MRGNVQVALRFQVAAEPERQNFVRIDALAVGFREVARPVDVDDARNGAGLVRVSAGSLKLRYVGRHTEKLREMSASRAAGDTNTIGIDLVCLGVCPHPANGRLRIMDRRGKLKLRRQPIRNCRGHKTAFGEFHAETVIPIALSRTESSGRVPVDGRTDPVEASQE